VSLLFFLIGLLGSKGVIVADTINSLFSFCEFLQKLIVENGGRQQQQHRCG
jgi:hypothetical protein